MGDRKLHFNGGKEIWSYRIFEDYVLIRTPEKKCWKATFADIDPYTAQEVEEYALHCQKNGENSENHKNGRHWKWDITASSIKTYVAAQMRPLYTEGQKISKNSGNRKPARPPKISSPRHNSQSKNS